MKSGPGDLAYGVEPPDACPAVVVGLQAAAGVMGCRDYRDGLFGHVKAELKALFVEVREAGADEIGRLAAYVQVDAVVPALF